MTRARPSRATLTVTAAMLAVAAGLPVRAADADDAFAYPAKPVHPIVAFPGGTAVDGPAGRMPGKLACSTLGIVDRAGITAERDRRSEAVSIVSSRCARPRTDFLGTISPR
jgi:hypothetical protein